MFFCHRGYNRRRRYSCAFSKLRTLHDGSVGRGEYFMKKECFKWCENHLPPIFFYILIGIDSIPFYILLLTAPPPLPLTISCFKRKPSNGWN